MRRGHCLWAAALLCAAATPAFAVEGTAAAGPIGGTDIRSALLPPPGIYGGGVAFDAPVRQFFDGHGALIPALSETRIVLAGVAPFLAWVPDIQVLGGSIGIGGIVSLGSQCGRLFAATPRRCINGAADPYVEVAWSRYFGTPRASQYPGALPIPEGLTLQLAFGTVIPVGSYDATIARSNGVTLGNNIWDFAPIIAATYVTRPILAEGTEISAKLYWNNYLTNPATHYSTGALLNVDFAVTERIGRFQAGLAGFTGRGRHVVRRAGRPGRPPPAPARSWRRGGLRHARDRRIHEAEGCVHGHHAEQPGRLWHCVHRDQEIALGSPPEAAAPPVDPFGSSWPSPAALAHGPQRATRFSAKAMPILRRLERTTLQKAATNE